MKIQAYPGIGHVRVALRLLMELDEGDENAASHFANRIFSERPACTAAESYAVYQDDAAIRYAQWYLTCNKELGINRCIDGLHQYASRFWFADTPTLTEDGVTMVFQMVDVLFPYSQKVVDKHPVDILLIDASTRVCTVKPLLCLQRKECRAASACTECRMRR